MEAIVPASNIKCFAKSLQCLGRIGSHAVIEVTSLRIVWRALNDSQAAYGCLTFLAGFFQAYKCRSHGSIKCRVSMRTLLWSLRPRLYTESISITIRLDSDGLLLELTDPRGIIQRLQINAEDISNVYSADSNKLSMPNVLAIHPKILLRKLADFQPSLEEVSLAVSSTGVCVRSYCDDDSLSPGSLTSAPSMIHTQANIRCTDFDRFELSEANQDDHELTFSLKELKAILTFCEALSCPFYFMFSGAGIPVIFSTSDGDPVPGSRTSVQFVLDMALATVNHWPDADDITAPTEIQSSFELAKHSGSENAQQKHSLRGSNVALTDTEKDDLEDEHDDEEVPCSQPPIIMSQKHIRSSDAARAVKRSRVFQSEVLSSGDDSMDDSSDNDAVPATP